MAHHPDPEPAHDEVQPGFYCPMCGAPNPAGARRCHDCGFHVEAAGPRPFSSTALWALAGLVVAFYVVSVLIVLAAR